MAISVISFFIARVIAENAHRSGNLHQSYYITHTPTYAILLDGARWGIAGTLRIRRYRRPSISWGSYAASLSWRLGLRSGYQR
jgi:hypothetical protein